MSLGLLGCRRFWFRSDVVASPCEGSALAPALSLDDKRVLRGEVWHAGLLWVRWVPEAVSRGLLRVWGEIC